MNRMDVSNDDFNTVMGINRISGLCITRTGVPRPCSNLFIKFTVWTLLNSNPGRLQGGQNICIYA